MGFGGCTMVEIGLPGVDWPGTIVESGDWLAYVVVWWVWYDDWWFCGGVWYGFVGLFLDLLVEYGGLLGE